MHKCSIQSMVRAKIDYSRTSCYKTLLLFQYVKSEAKKLVQEITMLAIMTLCYSTRYRQSRTDKQQILQRMIVRLEPYVVSFFAYPNNQMNCLDTSAGKIWKMESERLAPLIKVSTWFFVHKGCLPYLLRMSFVSPNASFSVYSLADQVFRPCHV